LIKSLTAAVTSAGVAFVAIAVVLAAISEAFWLTSAAEPFRFNAV